MRVYRKISDRSPKALKGRASVDDRVMFYRADNRQSFIVFFNRAFERPVVAFRSSGRKINFVRTRANTIGDYLARFRQRSFRFA